MMEAKTGIVTKKLDIPNNFERPTDKNRLSWFIHPLGKNFDRNTNFLPYWVPFASILPALLVFIVLYFEVEVIGYDIKLF